MKTDMMIHTKKTEMMRLVVEIEYVGKIADVFDKATWSFDGLQTEQVDLNYVHALNELHFHDVPTRIASVVDNSEYFFGLVTPFSLNVDKRSGLIAPPTQHHHHLCRCPATFYTTVAIAANSSPLPHRHQPTPLTPTTATTTAATAAAFPAVAGCGWKISHHHRGGAYTNPDLLFAFPCMGRSAAKPPLWRWSDGSTTTTAAPCGVGL
nr:hypothetical protein [Tanacetum cinerariifolium]